MSQDFVTRLQLQLREAALREERRTSVARRVRRARWHLPGPGPLVAALAAVLLALAVALGALSLRGEPEPAAPKVIRSFHVAAGLSSLAPGVGAVWTADPIGGEILRIDPTTRGVVRRIRVRGDARVATGAGAVWALTGDLLYAGDRGPVQLLRIDPSTDRVVARIPMLAPDGDGFGPVELQIGDGVVWVVGQSGALRIDSGSNAPDRFVSFAGEAARGAVAEGGRIWELSVDGRLRQFDVRTGKAVSEVGVRVPADSHLFPSGPDTLTLIGDNRSRCSTGPAGARCGRRRSPGDPVLDARRRLALGTRLPRLRRARPARPARRRLRAPARPGRAARARRRRDRQGRTRRLGRHARRQDRRRPVMRRG